MRYLGLDLGSKTLGVAVSDLTGTIATSKTVIHHNEEYDMLVQELKRWIDEYQITAIVLGYPKQLNNSVGEKALLSEAFKQKLEKVYGLPVYLEDERLTTKVATQVLLKHDVTRKKRKQVVDSMAAAVILQSFLDRKEN